MGYKSFTDRVTKIYMRTVDVFNPRKQIREGLEAGFRDGLSVDGATICHDRRSNPFS